MWRRPALTFPLPCLEAEFSPGSYAWHLRLCSIWSVLELEFYQGSGLFVLCTCFLVVKLFCSDCAHTQPLSSSLRVENKKGSCSGYKNGMFPRDSLHLFHPEKDGSFWNFLDCINENALWYP